MPNPCPCGSEIKPGQAELAYITQAIIDNVKGTAAIPVVALLDPLYGRAIDLRLLCAEPAPRPPESFADWFKSPIDFLDDILQAVLSITWNLWCKCSDCPPVTGCTGPNSFTVSVSDAVCNPPARVPETDSCYPCQVWDYVLNNTTTYYVEDGLGGCHGPYTGLELHWTCPSFDPPNGRVIATSYGGTGASWDRSTYGDTVTVYQGGTGGGGPIWVWVDDGTTVEEPPTLPACDPDAICDSINYISDSLTAIRLVLDPTGQVTGRLGSVASFHLPGVPDAISGNISQQLAAIAAYLAPPTSDQLINQTTTPLTETGTVDLTDQAWAEVTLTTVPNYYGTRGEGDDRIYYSGGRYGAPGWVVILGDDGVLYHKELIYPAGLQLPVPALATDLVVHLQPGVEAEVKTWQRAV